MKTTKIILFGLFLAVLLSSCKKNKTYEIKGIVYKDCSMVPAEGMTVRLANKHYPGTIKETLDVTTKVNRDGTFSIKYQNAGGGPLSLSVLPDETLNLNRDIDVGEIIAGGELVVELKLKASNYLTNLDTLYYRYGDYKLGEVNGKISGPLNDTLLGNIIITYGGISKTENWCCGVPSARVIYYINEKSSAEDEIIKELKPSPCSTDNELVIELN